LLDLSLHDLGYTYTGSDSLYKLSWNEVFNIVDASTLREEQLEDSKSGVRRGDLVKFDKFEASLAKKD